MQPERVQQDLAGCSVSKPAEPGDSPLGPAVPVAVAAVAVVAEVERMTVPAVGLAVERVAAHAWLASVVVGARLVCTELLGRGFVVGLVEAAGLVGAVGLGQLGWIAHLAGRAVDLRCSF